MYVYLTVKIRNTLHLRTVHCYLCQRSYQRSCQWQWVVCVQRKGAEQIFHAGVCNVHHLDGRQQLCLLAWSPHVLLQQSLPHLVGRCNFRINLRFTAKIYCNTIFHLLKCKDREFNANKKYLFKIYICNKIIIIVSLYGVHCMVVYCPDFDNNVILS